MTTVKPKNALLRSLVRGLRVAFAMFLMGALAYATQDPEWVFLTPIINTVGKFVREKYKVPYMPV